MSQGDRLPHDIRHATLRLYQYTDTTVFPNPFLPRRNLSPSQSPSQSQQSDTPGAGSSIEDESSSDLDDEQLQQLERDIATKEKELQIIDKYSAITKESACKPNYTRNTNVATYPRQGI